MRYINPRFTYLITYYMHEMRPNMHFQDKFPNFLVTPHFLLENINSCSEYQCNGFQRLTDYKVNSLSLTGVIALCCFEYFTVV